MIRRVFILEPNLVSTVGHPLEYCLGLQEFCHRIGLPVCVVGNARMSQDISVQFTNSYAGLTYSCFEFGYPASFFRDLLRLKEMYSIAADDLIVVTTCYVNQVVGAALFEDHVPYKQCPMIALNFHQLVPPSHNSLTEITDEYRREWCNRLGASFGMLKSSRSKVSLWTTASLGLNADYQEASGRPFGILPLIVAGASAYDMLNPSHSDTLQFGFIGDGRREKGLLVILEALTTGVESHAPPSFVIQLANVRGYESVDAALAFSLLERVSERSDVTTIQGALAPSAYRKVIERLNAVLLPYDPRHYARRASAIFVQAVVSATPVVVSDGTWMAEEVRVGRASGVIFEHIPEDLATTSVNFNRAVENLCVGFLAYQQTAVARAKVYADTHNAGHYLRTIATHYGEVLP